MLPSLQPLLPGLGLVTGLSVLAIGVASMAPLQQLSISPLVIGILLGALVGNTLQPRLLGSTKPGVLFSAKKILRLAIILYGFRVTFGEVLEVGATGLLLALIMVSGTLLLGRWVGVRFLGMDEDLSLLISSGAAICGAAAVIATESVLRSEAHKAAAAVGTVVLFGTLSMFLTPLLFHSGWIPMSEEVYGIYIGSTLHGVAHVVGAGNAISPVASDTAVIVKMTRVMLLVPYLFVLGWWWSRRSSQAAEGPGAPMPVPWFAVGFLAVVGLHSLSVLPAALVQALLQLDSFLLTMAMTALGLGTVLSRFKSMGLAPLYLAALLFVWLASGGLALTWLLA